MLRRRYRGSLQVDQNSMLGCRSATVLSFHLQFVYQDLCYVWKLRASFTFGLHVVTQGGLLIDGINSCISSLATIMPTTIYAQVRQRSFRAGHTVEEFLQLSL